MRSAIILTHPAFERRRPKCADIPVAEILEKSLGYAYCAVMPEGVVHFGLARADDGFVALNLIEPLGKLAHDAAMLTARELELEWDAE